MSVYLRGDPRKHKKEVGQIGRGRAIRENTDK